MEWLQLFLRPLLDTLPWHGAVHRRIRSRIQWCLQPILVFSGLAVRWHGWLSSYHSSRAISKCIWPVFCGGRNGSACRKLLFHCDMAVVYAWKSGTCKNKMAMKLIRRYPAYCWYWQPSGWCSLSSAGAQVPAAKSNCRPEPDGHDSTRHRERER